MIPAPLISALRARYDEAGRHYHSWEHIEALLRHFRRWEDHFHRPVPVLWALYWHDAIYDPQAKDNEEQSARLLESEAIDQLSPGDMEFAASIIRATAAHKVPADLGTEDAADAALFLDMDLSILGAPETVYDAYEVNIRREYAFVPLEAYRKGRGAVLSGFLSRERLYITDIAHDAWDRQARLNMKRALDGLDQLT